MHGECLMRHRLVRPILVVERTHCVCRWVIAFGDKWTILIISVCFQASTVSHGKVMFLATDI